MLETYLRVLGICLIQITLSLIYKEKGLELGICVIQITLSLIYKEKGLELQENCRILDGVNYSSQDSTAWTLFRQLWVWQLLMLGFLKRWRSERDKDGYIDDALDKRV